MTRARDQAGGKFSTADNLVNITLESTDADANVGPNLNLYRLSASPADNDIAGKIQFNSRNDNTQDVIYSEMYITTPDVSDGTEDGQLHIDTMVAGTSRSRLKLMPAETVFNENSIDLDFRVESNGNANMLFVDGGNDKVGIGTTAPNGVLEVHTAQNTTNQFTTPHLTLDTSATTNSTGFTGIAYSTSTGPNFGITAGALRAQANGKPSFVINTHEGSASGTEVMRINDTGAVTKPLQPAFQAIPASDQTNFAVNAAVTVVFGTEIFDQNADFASNTFTAPVTGKYQLNVKVRLENIDSANNSYHLSLDTSNRSYGYDFDPDFGQDNAIYTMSISTLADMDASDTAIVRIVQASGTAQTDIATESYFSGFLAC